MAVDRLWARDREQWERWERQHNLASISDMVAVVINYLAAEMGLLQQVHFRAGGATPTCTFQWLEEDCLQLLPPPPEGDYLQLPPPSPRGEVELPLPFRRRLLRNAARLYAAVYSYWRFV
ncbi:hypothetical protein EOD39_9269 [Acipenser ruthenus]|uniref:Uncharacterized protein n=1 Tax=Acipenser ruthenus TaxID=7906 RepID=A0A444U1D2_ACIRT|nr:hypothetical protein EOD39_9269 [Acipenser ruthenus]